MCRPLTACLFLLSAALSPISAHADAPFSLKSVTVDLPDSDRSFQGSGADAINNNCLGCHSAGMILNQPALSRAQWTAEVNKMVNTYKAPVASGDVAAIIDYLTKLRSTDQKSEP